ncbi:ATP-binding protein [Herbaspirillum sp. SJZ107]|uniref:ATP-binding protein n=1 Tax=Herbaspirillum sp. SJZ107 TaxID=2572881 RepID=UPI001150A7FD|nr:ATP-binding protein [Herbaspirillum sp. SJZ107]TQK03445.1 DNA helicase HerA-like ATPase [Herbaspirillum sp. SJZ107]
MTGMNLTPRTAGEIRKNAMLTLEAGRALINRSYLAELQDYAVQPLAGAALPFRRSSDLRLFRVERIVQGNKQSVLESTTAAYTALGAAGYSVFLFLRSDGRETELYIGTRGEPGKALGQSSGELLVETFKGHFSGSSLLPLGAREADELFDRMLAEKANPAASITAVTGVPALSTDNRDHFMQGLERFIDAAERRTYQALILAEPVSSQNLEQIRIGYEQVATQLSPLLKLNLTFGEQESESVGLSLSQSLSESLGESLAMTETHSQARTSGTSTTVTKGTSESVSGKTGAAKTATIAGTVLGGVAGALLGGPAGAMIGAQAAGSVLGTAFDKSRTTGTTESRAESRNDSETVSQGTSTGKTTSTTSTTGSTDSRSSNRTTGANRQISIETTDKSIEQLLGKIDHHLKRIDEAKTYGGWNSAAYFIGDSTASSEALASIFLGLIRGNNSSHEDFALTTWNSARKSAVLDWLGTLSHPPLQHGFSKRLPISFLTPATLVSGKELAIQLSLPRRSTSTVAVMETQAFGRKVQRLDGGTEAKTGVRKLVLGQIRHLWENLPQEIDLGLDQLSGHVFVSGSTGAGKSNTVYGMLDQIDAAGIPFLVIEPAKGEYKHVFGHRTDVRVFGTHPAHSELLRINPFHFPSAVHVLEHVDRLVEIFNVCWPMYAAMPAVLKEAILLAYEQCGWDLELSVNTHCDGLFPSFSDLLVTLEQVINGSVYSEEVKGNYIGSLATRIGSLTNGLNGQIFCADEIDSRVLFDSPAIVDLSRVGSAETKSLIMGILVMRLGEYRMAQGGMNLPLRHVTVLEEAHHLLRRSQSDGGAEGADLAGKSVEMLTNAIAEMRTFGEGFFIVDQSPNAVDIAAIRNTNTKIIMRLPEETDRRLIGKSAALRDDQLDEIARLPRGVAIVYQNDWLEPVLCQVKKFTGTEQPYAYTPSKRDGASSKTLNRHVLHLVLAGRVAEETTPDLDLMETALRTHPLLATSKIALLDAINAVRQGQVPFLCQEQAFEYTARVVVDMLGCRSRVQQLVLTAASYPQLDLHLDALLADCAVSLTSPLRLAARHCLMKDFSVQKKENMDIYSAWHAAIKTRNAL